MLKQVSLIRLEATPGYEREMAEFLNTLLPVTDEETNTVQCYAIKIGRSSFGIVDTFKTGDNYHPIGLEVLKVLQAKAPHLLAKEPTRSITHINSLDIVPSLTLAS